jgi:hypothetical protein
VGNSYWRSLKYKGITAVKLFLLGQLGSSSSIEKCVCDFFTFNALLKSPDTLHQICCCCITRTTQPKESFYDDILCCKKKYFCLSKLARNFAAFLLKPQKQYCTVFCIINVCIPPRKDREGGFNYSLSEYDSFKIQLYPVEECLRVTTLFSFSNIFRNTNLLH